MGFNWVFVFEIAETGREARGDPFASHTNIHSDRSQSFKNRIDWILIK